MSAIEVEAYRPARTFGIIGLLNCGLPI